MKGKVALLAIPFLLMGYVFAGDYDTQVNKCLNILAEQVKNNYSIDLTTGVTINGNDVNLSVYTGIKLPTETKKYMSEVLKVNPTTKGCEYAYDADPAYCEEKFSHVFFAKRNNIGTLKITPEKEGTGYWVATEFVTWGGEVGFQFPLQKRDDPQFDDYPYYNEGDDYGQLQRKIVYVQYLIDGTLLSCGFIKFRAMGHHTLNDLKQKNYLGNDFEGGSFESLGIFNRRGDKFHGMKVRIQGLDWSNANLFQMDVISVSYDNNSSFFNEYVAHPLQIKSMLDVTSMDGDKSMNMVMNKYITYITDHTCFEIAHKYSVFSDDNGNSQNYTLPAFCEGSYSDNIDLSYYIKPNFKKFVLGLIVDKVYAFPSLSEEEKKKARQRLSSLPNPTQYGLDIYIWRAINELKDENLRNYLIRAISPGARAFIKNAIERGNSVSYDDLVFLRCNLNHDQIVKNVEYLFKNYYRDGNLDLTNVKYLDPSFGDCIIPYPDLRHKDKFIENSFLSNKLTFIKNKFGEEKVLEYEKKIQEIKKKYDLKLSKLKKIYSEAILNGNKKEAEELSLKIKDLYQKMESEIKDIAKNDPKFSKYITVKEELVKSTPVKYLDKEAKSNSSRTYIIFILLGIILVIVSLILVTYKNKKGKK